MHESETVGAFAFAPLLLVACSAVIGLSGLLGWGLDIVALTRGMPEFQSMVPSTAFSFVLLCAAFAFGWTCDGGWRARLAYGGVFTVVAIVLVNLSCYLFLGHGGLDALVLGEALGADHMAVATGIGLLMACYCVIGLMAPDNPDIDGPVYFAIAGVSTSLGVIAGHVVDARTIYEIGVFHGMSANSALAFFFFFSAVLVFPFDRTGRSVFRD
ncbi:hypothetical protein [Pseudooceanicola sp. LIPI14-2-Ac024]|uniref:hypothetical protein n=1 Tax=Pseudooceanicola sp. LIPI14-2-Ac024 TaxID=3344875 RepID=UPI0035CFB973